MLSLSITFISVETFQTETYQPEIVTSSQGQRTIEGINVFQFKETTLYFIRHQRIFQQTYCHVCHQSCDQILPIVLLIMITFSISEPPSHFSYHDDQGSLMTHRGPGYRHTVPGAMQPSADIPVLFYQTNTAKKTNETENSSVVTKSPIKVSRRRTFTYVLYFQLFVNRVKSWLSQLDL